MPTQLFFPRPGEIAYRETGFVPLRRDEMRIKTHMTGPRHGEDRFVLRREAGREISFPFTPTTWGCGEVVELGGEAGPFQIGDMVHGPMIHADYQTCQVRDCYPLLWMRKEFSTFIEQGAYALRWVRQAHIRYGDTVNIVGMGAVGLMALQYCLANGALHVVSVDPLQDRLEVATRLGAHQVLTDREAAEMGEIHGAADVVLDFSGADAGLELACRLAKPGGELLPGAGHYSRKSIQYARDICRQQGIGYKEGGSEPKQKLTELTRGAISSKRVIVWPIISDYVSFHEMEPVYSKLADSPGSYLKVILTY